MEFRSLWQLVEQTYKKSLNQNYEKKWQNLFEIAIRTIAQNVNAVKLWILLFELILSGTLVHWIFSARWHAVIWQKKFVSIILTDTIGLNLQKFCSWE